MKPSIILLLILAILTACAPQPATPAIIDPLPVPVTAVPVATDVPAATAFPCTCPTSAVTPQQAGFVQPDQVVCSCPIMLVTPPPATTPADTNPQAIPAGGITLPDNGKTFLVHVGDGFLLNLGMDKFDWTVNIDDQNVVSREKGVMPIQGAQGVYQAAAPGKAVLSAVGDPLCRASKPACMAPSILFQVTIIVQ